MSSEENSDLHIAGCCCPGCGEALAAAGASQSPDSHIDPQQPVEQNAGGTSFPVNTVTADGLQLGDYVLSGLKWDTTQLTFSFPNSIGDYDYSRGGTFQSFNAAQKSAAIYALDMIEDYTNVRFTQLTGAQDRDADLKLAEESSAPTAYAFYPSNSASGGDIWFNSSSYNSPTLGNYAFSTIVHEIGHAMGLKHGHESSFAGALPYEFDSHEYSVMTYRSYVGASGSSYTDAPDSGPQTYMMADIAALQLMYGANFGTNASNTVYTFDQTTGQMSINGVGQLDAGGDTIFRTIWDGNGTDTYDLSNFTTDLAVDLRAGEGTDLDVGGTRFRADLGPNISSTFNNGYARKHVYNALLYQDDARSLIENARGGSGNDTFTGNAADNVLDGGAGNDRFFDSGGSDTYIGGAGTDEVSFFGQFSSYSFKAGASFLEVIGSAIDYVYDTVERLLFSDQSWDYAALAGTLVVVSPDAVEDSFTVQESAAGGLTGLGSVLANDTDDDGLALSVIAVNGQAALVGSVITLASGASLRVAADGTVSYGQNGVFAGLGAGETATDSFTYTVGNGSKSDTATVTITVDGVPDPNVVPVAANDAFGGPEGASITGNVLANDSDADGGTLQVTGVNGGGLSATLDSGATVSMNANGTFTYLQNGAFDALEPGERATDSFTYAMADGQGGTASATVTITVDGVADPNMAPIAANDAFRGDEGAAIGGNVLANDTDPENGALVVTAVQGGGMSATLASGASVTMSANGTFSYAQNGAFDALDLGQTATDSFSYTITDDRGATATATVSIVIDGVPAPNTAPVAADDTARGAEGAAIGGSVLDNDTDPDGDALQVTGVNGGGLNAVLASGASVSMNANGSFTYSQNGAFAGLEFGELGSDSFVYTISDGRGGTSTASVAVTIDGVTQDSDLTDLLPGPGDLLGTSGSDTIRGEKGDQVIFGFDGDDTLEAKYGSDILAGGAGSDRLRSDKWSPTTFYFGTEQDNGVVEVDRIDNFDEAKDAIDLGGGAVASVTVGRRETVLTLEGDGDQIVLRFVSGIAAVSFIDDGAKAADAGGGDLLPGWNDLTGTGASEDLFGTAADDRMFGIGGGDWMWGNEGDDVLVGGSGNDKLYGGAGADTFVFQSETRNGSEDHDAILDWGAGDTIRLVGASVVSSTVQHNGIVLHLDGDGDHIFVKHVFDIDDLTFA